MPTKPTIPTELTGARNSSVNQNPIDETANLARNANIDGVLNALKTNLDPNITQCFDDEGRCLCSDCDAGRSTCMFDASTG